MSTVETTDSAADPVRVLAERVRALRASTGLSQRALAKQIYSSHTTINRAENGHWPIRWDTVKAIITGCGVPETDLPPWLSLWEQARDQESKVPRHSLPAPIKMGGTLGIGTKYREFFGDDGDTVRIERPRRGESLGAMNVPGLRPHLSSYRTGLFLPDRNTVRTVPQYISALRQLRASVNHPSWREMAERAKCSRNTLHDLIRPGRVELKWRVVYAFLLGCGLTDSEIDLWHAIFRRLRVRPRPKSFRRRDPHSPPPLVDLTNITSVPQYIDALRKLNAVGKRSIDEVIRTAYMHQGTRILCRSALFGRFRRAVHTGVLPERDVVVGYLRGCYCDTLGRECAPDCGADLIAPWLRLYDKLHQQYLSDSAQNGIASVQKNAPIAAIDDQTT